MDEAVDGNLIFVVSIIQTLFFVGLACSLAKWRKVDIWGEFPKHKRLWPLLCGVLLLDFVAVPLLEEVFPIPEDPEFDAWLADMNWFQIIIAFAVCAAIWEEYLFHGLLLTWFKRKWGVLSAIFAPNLVWSTLHTQYDVFWIAMLFVSGCLWSLMRIWGLPLWGLMLVHFLNNVLAFLLEEFLP